MIGVLSGGSASCQTIMGTDSFSKISKAWERGLGDILMLGAAQGGTVYRGDSANTSGLIPKTRPSMGGTWGHSVGETDGVVQGTLSLAVITIGVALMTAGLSL